MGIVNANCPTDQAALKALYAHKAACLSRFKNAQAIENDVQRIFAMNRLADRRAAIDAVGVEKGEAYQGNVKTRLIELHQARTAHNKAQLAASKARLKALECLEDVD